MSDAKVLVCVPTAEYARRADFYDHFMMLEMETGWARVTPHGQSPARNRNIAIDLALNPENGFTHVFFLDDDLVFPRTIIKNLLKHDVDIVGGLYLMRSYPHQPIAFDRADERGYCAHRFLKSTDEGLVEVVSTGLGCVLIKCDVFRKLEKPYVRLGAIEKDHWCDDVDLWNRARKVGFKVFVDTSIHVGHMASVTIWPAKVDGKWYTSYESNGTRAVTTPQIDGDVPIAVEGIVEQV